MKYYTLPGMQERLSILGLGTWVFGGENWGGADDEACIRTVGESLASGMNVIDTAPFYGNGRSETLIGRALKGKREQAFVATKCGLLRSGGRVALDLSPASVEREADLSLQRLQCDVIDLYQCHWPDKNVPVETTMETLGTLQARKKIRLIGVCNFDLPLLERALAVAPVKTLQIQYSLLERGIEKELLPFCREKGIGVMVYGPMGGGILTGKYKESPQLNKADARSMFYKYYAGSRFETIRAGLAQLRFLGHPLNQLALNWVRQQPGVVCVLAGARSAAQVRENAAATDWDLSPDELARIAEIVF